GAVLEQVMRARVLNRWRAVAELSSWATAASLAPATHLERALRSMVSLLGPLQNACDSCSVRNSGPFRLSCPIIQVPAGNFFDVAEGSHELDEHLALADRPGR